MEESGFQDAPRFLGIDDLGREVLSFVEGWVPDNLDDSLTDGQLPAAAQLLRRFHDATSQTSLTAGTEVVCHNDVSPVNTVFIGDQPTALIDFDLASAIESTPASSPSLWPSFRPTRLSYFGALLQSSAPSNLVASVGRRRFGSSASWATSLPIVTDLPMN